MTERGQENASFEWRCSDQDVSAGAVEIWLGKIAEFCGDQPSLEAYVLNHGSEFTPGRRVDNPGTPTMCFHNSQRAALTRGFEPVGGLCYVEGFAIPVVAPWPFHHGWLVDDDGLVIETTWPDLGLGYFGVKIPDLADRMRSRQAWGSMLEDLAVEELKGIGTIG